MENKNNSKVVIITGINGGIGLATANYLLEKGYKVYGITKRDYHNDKFVSYTADVNDYNKVKDIFVEIEKLEGRIDALINNAGFGIAGSLENTEPQKIYDIINTNLSAVITLMSLAIPFLKKTKGKIINISSIGGIVPLPFQACYSASKAGVEIVSRAMANELKVDGIKVVAVLPGDTKTSFTESRIKTQQKTQNKKTSIESRSINKMEKWERNGKSPITVSKVVYKALKKKNPPLKISVSFPYKLLSLFIRFLPSKFLNFLVRHIYC